MDDAAGALSRASLPVEEGGQGEGAEPARGAAEEDAAGQAVAPGLFEVIVALGRDRVVARLRRAAATIRGE